MRCLHLVYKINAYRGNCVHFRNYWTDVTSWVYSQQYIWYLISIRVGVKQSKLEWISKCSFMDLPKKVASCTPKFVHNITYSLCLHAIYNFSWNFFFLVGQHLKKCTKDSDMHCRTCCVNSSESISNNRVVSIQRNQERKGRICKLCSHPSGTISQHCFSVWSFHRLTSKLLRRKILVHL
jgi:hypothetical protein